MSIMDSVTLGIAVLGATLGLINTWRSIERDRIKLMVMPKKAIPVGGAELVHPNINFCIEVINLSIIPLIISEVGFLYKGSDRRGVIIQPLSSDGSSIPRKLEAREAITFYIEVPQPKANRPFRAAYAKTSCGRTFKGSSPALKGLNR